MTYVDNIDDYIPVKFLLFGYFYDYVAGLRFGVYSGLLLGAPVIFTIYFIYILPVLYRSALFYLG